MSLIQRVSPDGAPRCPLCYKWMGRGMNTLQKVEIFFCSEPGCKIACNVKDPFVGRWEEALHKSTKGKGITCPKPGCGEKMRYFATYIGFMKTVCPKCHTSLSNKETDRKKTDKTYTPDDRSPVQ